MFKFIINLTQKLIIFIFIKISFAKRKKLNLKNINFKQIDFINYKKIKQYVFKENFFYDKNFIDSHSFEFLFYLQKIGGKSGIEISKKNIFLWFNLFKNKLEFPWDEKLTAQRLLSIYYNYEFVSSVLSKTENTLLNKIINIHIKRLFFFFKRKNLDEISSYEIVAFILSKLLLKEFNQGFLKKIEKIIEIQIDRAGIHKSYNVLEQAKFINNLNEVKNILLFFKIVVPEKINFFILNMTSALNQYIHQDGTVALFNGANNNYQKQIQDIIEKEEFLKSRTFTNNNGIAFYSDKKRSLFFDVVQPNNLKVSKSLGAGTLSFELSIQDEKIITNCGASESYGKNPEYLRYSAAHSTIILKNTNISEIKAGNPHIKYPQKVSFQKNDFEKIIDFEGSHNGYLRKFKKIIKRKIIIEKNEDKIHGEDSIISLKSTNSKTVYHIRFHLMPDITTNITTNKKNIILKTKKNKIWMFKSNSELGLEKSIYVDNNSTKETQQIVIKGITDSTKKIEKWSIEAI